MTAGPLFGQVDFLTEVEPAFQQFTDDIAVTLPYLSAVGLNWNDAYIGNFPHFAVGMSGGFATVPYDSIQDLATNLGATSSILGSPFDSIGVPIPMWCLDGRLGGFGIPFDMGFKIGFLPEEAQVLLPKDMAFDYLMIGADFRLSLLQDVGPTPDISIGIGATYLGGSVTVYNATPGTTINFAEGDVTIGAGDFFFDWQALTIDLKAQVSKNIVFFTLSAGVAGSYSVYAEATGGVYAPISYTGTNEATLEAAYSALGLSSNSFTVTGTANGWSFRAFGGIAFDLTIIKIDLMGMYNILSNALGATLNVRVQL